MTARRGTRVKFCGIASVEDARLAAEHGVDEIGLIFAASPRRIDLATAVLVVGSLPPTIVPVGVFVDPTSEEIAAALGAIPNLTLQLSGDESPAFVDRLSAPIVKAIHVDPSGESEASLRARADRYPRARLLFDTRSAAMAGGTGTTFAWNGLAALAREREIVVAGGLTPENVGACVRDIRPFGVDVRSGLETDGRKDAAKMRAFMEAVRTNDAA
jgi:phosphoribosylanthranilate isomerase